MISNVPQWEGAHFSSYLGWKPDWRKRALPPVCLIGQSISYKAELPFAVFNNKSSSYSRTRFKWQTQSSDSQLAVVGFEPMPPERLEPKSSAFDHSATLPCVLVFTQTKPRRKDEKSTLTTIGQSNRKHTWKSIRNFKHIPCGSIGL